MGGFNNCWTGFTFGDRQDRDIDEELHNTYQDLRAVLADAGKRYVLFDNTATAEDKFRQAQKVLSFGKYEPLMHLFLVHASWGCRC